MHWKPTWKRLKKLPASLRLRDLGGIIVVDFIDMKLMENKKKLADAMDSSCGQTGPNMRYYRSANLV